MQMVITFMAVVGGMIFSLAVALLAEELIFGQVIRVFFVRQTVTEKTEGNAKAQRRTTMLALRNLLLQVAWE